ncbi:hypothetical protein I7I53_07247 [Histoplasma capsulatum var. duboisii H88]|uniref:Uncharacterized protein n=1 Tax=Ajellomyces capsulatus (strain H88) TaxID=544711 RepID=A0A8A1LD15_AJEC8|nr:hypothetical protein I7I53_07247 [Histoplasma capsulatum var. duboisii H88]
MPRISASRGIHWVRRKYGWTSSLTEDTLRSWPEHENSTPKWEAKGVSGAKHPLILSKLLKRWRESWLQMPAEVDSGSFVDANPKAEAEPFDESGRPPVFVQRVHIQRWQSYAPIQETVFRSHETGLLVASSEYSTGPHEWYHAGQYYQEDTSISLEMLLKAPHEFRRKAQKGRLTRTKEWLTNHRNSSRLSFTSPISSRSSGTSPFPPFPSPPGSPLPCRDSYCSELPDSTRCELADTSIVIENPTSLCQASLSAGSVPPQYSDSGEVKSNQNGFECAVQDICPISKTECQIYQSSPVSNADSCTSPSLNRATNLDNGDVINQLNPHPLKESLPLVVNCCTWEIKAMRDTETLPSYDPQKDDSTETQLREKGRIYDSVYLEKSNHESPQRISNHANGQNGGSYYGSGIKSNSSYHSSTSIFGNGGDRHGKRGYGNCDESENNSQDEDDDGDNNRKRKRFRHLTPGSGQRQFACVYNKYDPETYHGDRDRKYLTCSGTSFKYFSLLAYVKGFSKFPFELFSPFVHHAFRANESVGDIFLGLMMNTYAAVVSEPLRVKTSKPVTLQIVLSSFSALKKINGPLCGERGSQGWICRNLHVSLIPFLVYYVFLIYMHNPSTIHSGIQI